MCVCVCVRERERLTQSCPTLSDPVDWSLPSPSLHGILQTRILEWVAISFSIIILVRFVVVIIEWMFITIVASAKSLQTCLTFCSPIDCSPPVSSVPGILQARILEWVTMPSFKGSTPPRDWTHVFYISYICSQVTLWLVNKCLLLLLFLP